MILMNRLHFNSHRPRILKPELTVHPARQAKCLVLGKPSKMLARWLMREYLPKRTIRLRGSRTLTYKRERRWLRTHGFLTRDQVEEQLTLTWRNTAPYLSRIVFPYRRTGWYYDAEVLALENLLINHGHNGIIPRKYVQHNDPTPIKIPIYSVHSRYAQRNQLAQEEPDGE